MSKEEIKQYLRNQIDSSVKIQDTYNKEWWDLYYVKSYLRALKFSTITCKPVNQHNFTGGELLFHIDTKYKKLWHYSIINEYLNDNYSTDYHVQVKIVEEVFNEYDEYKSYKYINND